jgi:hypothetical protein
MPLKIFESLRALRLWRAPASSLHRQLWLLWLFIVLLCAFMTVILVDLYRSGSAVQLEAGRRVTRSTCESIRSVYTSNVVQHGSLNQADRDLLTMLVSAGLADATGIEGGIWDRERGFIAYAFPTHEGGHDQARRSCRRNAVDRRASQEVAFRGNGIRRNQARGA